MLEINVTVDTKQFAAEMAVFANQIPYATAKAINYAAIDAQKAERAHINSAFIVRRQSWVNNSVKIKPFAKKDSLFADISIAPAGGNDVLSQFEDGGKKESLTSGLLAIPNTGVIRSNIRQIIPSAKRPRNLQGAVKLTSRTDHETRLFVRIGRGKASQLRPAYRLVKSVVLPPKLEFEKTIVRSVSETWTDSFNKGWNDAIATALR